MRTPFIVVVVVVFVHFHILIMVADFQRNEIRGFPSMFFFTAFVFDGMSMYKLRFVLFSQPCAICFFFFFFFCLFCFLSFITMACICCSSTIFVVDDNKFVWMNFCHDEYIYYTLFHLHFHVISNHHYDKIIIFLRWT
jgi:hypothetical protein